MVYPAALQNVMGVASTNNQDQRSSFSNYGNQIVWVAAPGEGIITDLSVRFVRGRVGNLLQFADGCRHCFAGPEHAARRRTIAGGLGHAHAQLVGLQHGQWPVGRLLAPCQPSTRSRACFTRTVGTS